MRTIVARLASVVGFVGLSACGPILEMEATSPAGPRISDLQIVTSRVTAGCPITLRVHLESAARSVDQALVGWVRLARRSQTSQYVALAVRQERAEGTLGPPTLGRIAVDVPESETPQCS